MNLVSKVGPLVSKVKHPLELLLVFLIVLRWAPFEVLGSQVNSKIKSVVQMTKIHAFMNNVYVRTFLWLVLLHSCCFTKDMRLFMLIVLYFASR